MLKFILAGGFVRDLVAVPPSILEEMAVAAQGSSILPNPAGHHSSPPVGQLNVIHHFIQAVLSIYQQSLPARMERILGDEPDIT